MNLIQDNDLKEEDGNEQKQHNRTNLFLSIEESGIKIPSVGKMTTTKSLSRLLNLLYPRICVKFWPLQIIIKYTRGKNRGKYQINDLRESF